MTRFGTRRSPMQEPLTPLEDTHSDSEADHRRALVLSEVAAEGPIGLYRVLRRAVSGDTDAAGIRVSGLVRALPGVTFMDSHDLLLQAHIADAALAGHLTPGQRVALCSVIDRTEHLYDHPRT
ncbi:hypothetical protein [Actinacidiphila paucisporea]|uniref:Uncharacterized protein n=1 Tax=Actinacidiphila paucisporea TaxID=310782 RepID=A0A1M7BT59_9ACTN|nr:hypothetical protein [Actinacidiphila paucisporea]SHL58123.1 hypothetical protein SAMN05216499_10531 [Actinacidiphila paucisporea]